MGLTFIEAIERLEDARQKRAVWTRVVDTLGKLIDKEGREAGQGIPAVGCVAKVVSQDIVVEIVQGIEADKISPLSEEINHLENLQVVETKNDKKKGKRKTAVKKNPKGVRVVPSPRQRATGAGK